jgi:hypothetical protein
MQQVCKSTKIGSLTDNIGGALKVGIAGFYAPSTEALIGLLDTIGFQPLRNSKA